MRSLGEHAEGLADATRRALRHALTYEALVEPIASIAQDDGTALIALKGFALYAGGFAEPGSREVGDLDLLVDPAAGSRLHAALLEEGFTTSGGPANEHHLPPLASPSWGVVDLHFAVRGLDGRAGRWLAADEVLAYGSPCRLGSGLWVPDPVLLAAHTITHCLEQHALNPNPYPLLRALGDLHDLLPTREKWQGARQVLSDWLRSSVSRQEIAAMMSLCLDLKEGLMPEPKSPSNLLLAHLVAHRFDESYRKSLGSKHLRHRLAQALRRRTLVGYARRKLGGLFRQPTPGGYPRKP